MPKFQDFTCVLDHRPVPAPNLYLDHHPSHHLHIIPQLNTTTAWEVCLPAAARFAKFSYQEDWTTDLHTPTNQFPGNM